LTWATSTLLPQASRTNPGTREKLFAGLLEDAAVEVLSRAAITTRSFLLKNFREISWFGEEETT